MRLKFPLLFPVFVLTFIACQKAPKNASTQKNTDAAKPNIVLIVADDQGWGDLRMNGNTDIATPHIDALAENGVSFENFYVQPVCSPTRAELLTGRYFTRLGVHKTSAGGERLNLGETTIADIFRKAGYTTAAYGKWHNGSQPPYHPNSRGFDDYYGFTSGHWGNYFDPLLEHNGKIVKGKGFLVDDLCNRGVDFITKNKNRPFFLYLPLNTPHSPMQVPDAYYNRFKNKQLALGYEGEETTALTHTKAALAMVENIDYNVGKIMARLKKLALEENTIVIYLSDNGPNGWRWNGGMRGRKGTTDEGGVRSPFLLQWKGKVAPGKVVTEIASSIDLLPTLAALSGIAAKTEKPIDGLSLKPLILGSNATWSDRFIFNHWNGKTSIRTQDFRLDHKNRLYAIATDRGQTTDLATQYSQLVDSLVQVKKDWLKATDPTSGKTDDRPFTLGHGDHTYTLLPARDGTAHGHIERSNRHPNDSFFTNWSSVKDSISWDVEVLQEGTFEVTLYYTMKAENAGVAVQLSHGDSKLLTRIETPHDPPLTGMENDRDTRIESYVKDFKPKRLGEMRLQKGRSLLTVQIPFMDGNGGIDLRLLQFKRLP